MFHLQLLVPQQVANARRASSPIAPPPMSRQAEDHQLAAGRRNIGAVALPSTTRTIDHCLIDIGTCDRPPYSPVTGSTYACSEWMRTQMNVRSSASARSPASQEIG